MRQTEQDLLWRMADPPVRALFDLVFRIRFWGTRHLPRTGPGLLAANHISVLDPIVIALAPSALGRTLRFLAAAEFFDRPVVGWMLRAVHQIPVRRGGRDRAALRELGEVVREGNLAGIFPEGRIGRGDRLGHGRRGAARIALAAGVPVIPVGIWGTHARWPQAGLHLRPPARPRVAVLFGPPIPSGGDPRSRADVQALTATVMSEIGRLVSEAQQATGDPAAGRAR